MNFYEHNGFFNLAAYFEPLYRRLLLTIYIDYSLLFGEIIIIVVCQEVKELIYKYISGSSDSFLWDKYLSTKREMYNLRVEHWLKNEFLSFQWFSIIIISLILTFIWWRLLDKRRLMEIFLFGFFVATLASILDGFGTELNAWDYGYKVLPTLFPLIAVDLLMVPFIMTLLYQYTTSWKTFGIAVTIMSAIFSFIVEPILKSCGIYHLYTWKYYYSFPIYIFVGLFCKWLMQVIIHRQTRENNK